MAYAFRKIHVRTAFNSESLRDVVLATHTHAFVDFNACDIARLYSESPSFLNSREARNICTPFSVRNS